MSFLHWLIDILSQLYRQHMSSWGKMTRWLNTSEETYTQFMLWCAFVVISCQSIYWVNLTIDLFHKSHNALVPYPTMHFVTELCTISLQNGELWNIRLMHCRKCEMGLLPKCQWCNPEVYGWMVHLNPPGAMINQCKPKHNKTVVISYGTKFIKTMLYMG